MKKICMMLGLCLTLTGCNAATSASREVVDQVANVVQEEEEHVLMVKNGYPQSYPNCPYGKVFDEFFASPTWTYFKGDGGEDVVEFTGYCTYRDAEVKARLQFILNVEEGTFESGALSFNDVPQVELITVSMIEKAFQTYMVSDGTLWEVLTALYFRWTCLPDCAVPELDADYRRNNRRLS